jgi:AraC family transcriptional regulator
MSAQALSAPAWEAAERRASIASVQAIEISLTSPVDMILRDENHYRLDFAPRARLPRTEVCFVRRWPSHRFSPAGKLFLLPPGEDLRIRAEPGPLSLVLCNIRRDDFHEWFGAEFEWGGRRLEASTDLHSAPLICLLRQLGREVRQPGFASDVMIEGVTLQIAATLARQLRALDSDAGRGGLAPWRLRAIDEQLAKTDKTPTLVDLAQACQLSVRQLSRAFRASRGVTLGEYVAERRLDVAKRLLAQGRSVQSVAAAVGFSSPSSFSFAFRRATAMTPNEFRSREAAALPP